MKTVIFRVAEAGDVAAILRTVLSNVAPKVVDRLYPETKNPALASRYFVRLEEDDKRSLSSRIDALRAIPGISNVELAADRRLIE